MSEARLKRRSRKCSACGCWYAADPRVGTRQKTCGREACRKVRKARVQREWSRRNPDYWTERRLREQAARMEGAKGSKPVVGLPPPPEIRRLPLERGRAVLGAEALVFLLTYGLFLYRGPQPEIRTQVAEIRK